MNKSSTEYLTTDYEVKFANLISDVIVPKFTELQALVIEDIDKEEISSQSYELGIFLSSLFFFQLTSLIERFTDTGWNHFYLRISLFANEQGWLATNNVAQFTMNGDDVLSKIEAANPENVTEMAKIMRGLLSDLYISEETLSEEERILSNLISDELVSRISEELDSFYPILKTSTDPLGPFPQLEPVYLVMGEYIPNEHPSSRKSEVLDGREKAGRGILVFLAIIAVLIYLVLR